MCCMLKAYRNRKKENPMNLTAAATASAKSWTKLAEGLDAQAEIFADLKGVPGQEFLTSLVYDIPKAAADRAHAAAAKAAARA